MALGPIASLFRELGKEKPNAYSAVVAGGADPHHHNPGTTLALEKFRIVEVAHGIGTRPALVAAGSTVACNPIARAVLASLKPAAQLMHLTFRECLGSNWCILPNSQPKPSATMALV